MIFASVSKRGRDSLAREFRLARNTVRGIVRKDETEHRHERKTQPLPKLGGFAARLTEMLVENSNRPKRERLTFQRIFEELRLAGYRGGYDAVRRFGRAWQRQQLAAEAEAYIPLVFAPGEAYQFDWSHVIVEIDGLRSPCMLPAVRSDRWTASVPPDQPALRAHVDHRHH